MYTRLWEAFVEWCNNRRPPQVPLQTLEFTLTLYMVWMTTKSTSFLVIKVASAAIRSRHLLAGFTSPTDSVHSQLVRTNAKNKLGLKTKMSSNPRQHTTLRTSAQSCAMTKRQHPCLLQAYLPLHPWLVLAGLIAYTN